MNEPKKPVSKRLLARLSHKKRLRTNNPQPFDSTSKMETITSGKGVGNRSRLRVKQRSRTYKHHVKELSDGSADSPSSAVALCSNCHYRVHHGNDGNELNKWLTEMFEDLRGQVPKLIKAERLEMFFSISFRLVPSPVPVFCRSKR